MTGAPSQALRPAPVRPADRLTLSIRRPSDSDRPLAQLSSMRAELRAQMLADGGVLLRGWDISGAEALTEAMSALGIEAMAYDERTTRRVRVTGGIYTSTEHPARQEILPHNENAYAANWPALLCFACATPARDGGETPLYDCRRVLECIDPEIVDELTRREILHVRNFGTGLGLSVQEAFGTDDRKAVERRLLGSGCEWRWRADGGLTTKRRTRPLLVHPVTGERCFFSHVAFFHQSSLPEEAREAMLELFGPNGLPHAMFYGDGGEIADSTIAALLAAYRRNRQLVAWQTGDLLLIDNMLLAHGRRPFTGERLILVALAEEIARSQVRFD